MLLMCRLWVSEANHPLQRYSAHQKSLSFWWKAKYFLFLFLWSLFPLSSAALSVASKGASMKQHCSDPVSNMLEGEFFQKHLHIQ